MMEKMKTSCLETAKDNLSSALEKLGRMEVECFDEDSLDDALTNIEDAIDLINHALDEIRESERNGIQ